MEIVLIRHGYSTANRDGLYSGWIDVSLTEEGEKELEAYRKQYHYPKTDRYYTSDLKRAIQTCHILYPDEKIVEKSSQLREIHYGDLEGVVWGERPNFSFNEHFFRNERVYNAEVFTEFARRIYQKLEEIVWDLERDGLESATIVAHAGVIKTFLILLENRPFSDFSRLNAPNGLGYRLVLELDENKRIKLLERHELELASHV